MVRIKAMRPVADTTMCSNRGALVSTDARRACTGNVCHPATAYDSGGFSGTRSLGSEDEEAVRIRLLTLGFVEKLSAP